MDSPDSRLGGDRPGRVSATVLLEGTPVGPGEHRRAARVQFNQGAHAIYLGGAGNAVLGRLGVSHTGDPPSVTGTHGFRGDLVSPLPFQPRRGDQERTRLVPWQGHAAARTGHQPRHVPRSPTAPPRPGSSTSGCATTPPGHAPSCRGVFSDDLEHQRRRGRASPPARRVARGLVPRRGLADARRRATRRHARREARSTGAPSLRSQSARTAAAGSNAPAVTEMHAVRGNTVIVAGLAPQAAAASFPVPAWTDSVSRSP